MRGFKIGRMHLKRLEGQDHKTKMIVNRFEGKLFKTEIDLCGVCRSAMANLVVQNMW